MKAFFIAFLLLQSEKSAIAQYNDSVHHYTQLLSTGSFNKTNNNNSTLFSNQLTLGLKEKSISLNSTTTWVYGTQQSTLTNNDLSTALDFNVYRLVPHAYYWGLVDYTSSYSLKINDQYQSGAGLAYNVIDHKHLKLNFSDGILFENSDIYLQDSVNDRYNTFRNSFRVRLKWDTGIVSFNGNFFLQNSVNSANDYIIKANIATSVKIKKWFTLTLSYIYNRFNRTARENSLFTYGITIQKYF